MTPSAQFWDKAAPKYAKSAISDIDAYRATLASTIEHLNPTDRVLELGCGTATTALEIAPHVAHLTASDISPAMVAIGQEKLREAGVENVTLRIAAAADPVLAEDAPYDAILAMNLLHLLPDRAAVLTHVYGLLRPGGLFISKSACLGEKWFFRPLVSVMQWIGKAPYVSQDRAETLRAAILDAGFEPVEKIVQKGSAPRLYLVARKI